MSGDKRTVSTDALETLGTIIDETAGRDAIHLAVEPVIARHDMTPGTHINIDTDGLAYEVDSYTGIGIVDPFLKKPVKKGERFWLVVYPRQITSLRHVWTHPAFEAIAKAQEVTKLSEMKAASEAYLRELTKEWCGPSYDELLKLAYGEDCTTPDDMYGSYGWSNQGKYILSIGFDGMSGETIPGGIDNLWDHVEIITGKKMPHRPEYFSCGC